MNKLNWLSQLIAFDTTSRNSNLELINYVDFYFQEQKLISHILRDAKQPKANLFATLPAHDGTTTGGLVLSGHTDVVPVDGQKWDSNPFEMTQRDDKIYGRGSCDMKGFIAIALSLIPEFKKLKLKKPIHFALSYDEEIGCLGAPFMIDDIQKRKVKPEACIVGEPTDMRPVVAHKGRHSFRCTVHGVAAHSSLTNQGCNAIEHAARMICFIRDMADDFKSKGAQDQHYDVPFTTITTNVINGGTGYNILPALCEFVFEFRHLREDDPKKIRADIQNYISNKMLPEMKKENSAANVVLDTLSATVGFNASEEDAITLLTRKLQQDQDIFKVAYGTEAGLFQQADIPTLLCGPGSIEQAHRANEFVLLDQLEQCEAFLKKLIHEFCV
jgi:acetylornithine deacetylase